MLRKTLALPFLLALGTIVTPTQADDDFGAGFAGGLFGGTLLSAAASRPRQERVYIERQDDKEIEQKRSQLQEYEEKLERKERALT